MIASSLKKSLVLKTTVIFLIAAMVPFVLASLFYYKSSKNALSEEIASSLQTKTELIRDAVDARVSLLRSNAIAWADLEVMNDILTDDIDNRISDLLESLMKDYDIAGNIYIINRKAEVVAANKVTATKTTIEAPWLSELLTGKIMARDVHQAMITDEDVIAFLVPIFSDLPGPAIIGALLLEYRVADLQKLAYKNESTVISILTKKGQVVAAYPPKNPFTITRGQAGLKHDHDAKSKEMISVPGYIGAIVRTRGSAEFAGFDWDVIVAIKQARAMAPIKRIQHISIAIGLTGIVLILGLVTIFARKITRPLKELSHTADLIANTKDFSLIAHSSSKDDEVGRLATAFNRMISEVNLYVKRIKKMEDELVRADKLSALGELSAGMAHEVKNPLGIIKSSAELLSTKLDQNESTGRLAAAITEESARLENFLEAFLQFARPAPPQIGQHQVNEIIKKALPLLEPHMESAKIKLTKKFANALPEVYTDDNQVNQVLINIIINAVQAMPSGGTIEVSTRESFEYPPFNPTNQVNVVIITITDSGSGISTENKDKVFNPFFTTKEKGTGLGLTIVYRIIGNLGGWVNTDNVEPHGTAFKIYLPTGSKTIRKPQNH